MVLLCYQRIGYISILIIFIILNFQDSFTIFKHILESLEIVHSRPRTPIQIKIFDIKTKRKWSST